MAKKKEVNFEQGLQRLQEIVESLEHGTSTLEETISLYEEGVKLAAELNETLENAETRIEELSADFKPNEPPNGDNPFDEEPNGEDGGLF